MNEEKDLAVPIATSGNSNLENPNAAAYNSRDPAAAQASSFVAAFGNLKKSELYKEPEKESTKPGCSSKIEDNVIAKPVPANAQRLGKTGPILVSPRQRGNPLLKSINSVPWEYEEIIPDYVMGVTTCALFLTLRYHNLNPDYIHERLKLLGKKYKLRLLVVQVDLADPAQTVKHLNRLCILADLTMMLAGSPEEAGRIIETYKVFEAKPPEMIMEKKEGDVHNKVQNALTSVRSVNKTDALTLMKNFGSLEKILKASLNDFELCPGFGQQKAQRLHSTLHQPFLRRN